MEHSAPIWPEDFVTVQREILEESDFEDASVSQILAELLRERGWLVKDAIRACCLDRSYGYQMFNGTRLPTRNFLLRLALALGLSPVEAQHLLARCAKPVLYPRNRHDAALLYALDARLSLDDAHELLLSLGEEGLL